MTVTTTTIRRETVGDGTTTNFTFDFKLLSTAHLQVYVDGALQASGYTVPTTLPSVGGTITFTSAPADGADILFIRQLPATQVDVLSVTGQLPSTTLEGMIDKAIMLIQQLDERIDRIPTLAIDSTLDGLEFPAPGAGELITWNDDGTALITVDPDDVLIGDTLPDPVDGSVLRWDGTDLSNLTVADLADEVADLINDALGDVVGPATATDHSIAFFDGTTGKLLKSDLGLGSAGQKLQSAGAGAMPVWATDAGSIVPDGLGKFTAMTTTTGRSLAVMLSNGVLVVGGLATYIPRGSSSGYIPLGQVMFDAEHAPPAGETIVDWAYNEANLYVVLSNGWAYSAGQNATGQLGHNDTTARYKLTRIEWFVTNTVTVEQVFCTPGGGTATHDTVFWVADDNKVYGVGRNTSGQLGVGDSTNRDEPVEVYDAAANTIVDIQTVLASVGWSAMILSDGTLLMTGNNADGQLGQGNTTALDVWTSVALADCVAMKCIQTAGPAANIAVVTSTSSHSLHVWGANAFYQGANGGTADKTSPGAALLTTVNPDFFGFSGGYTTISCYCLLDNGDLYTWGANGLNNIFAEDTTTDQTPTKNFDQVCVGVWGNISATATSAVYGNIYAMDEDAVLRIGGTNTTQHAFSSTACPDYTSGTYRAALPVELAQADDTIDTLLIQNKGGHNQTAFLLTTAGSLYGSGYASDQQLTNYQTQTIQPTDLYNHRLNRYLWGV